MHAFVLACVIVGSSVQLLLCRLLGTATASPMTHDFYRGAHALSVARGSLLAPAREAHPCQSSVCAARSHSTQQEHPRPHHWVAGRREDDHMHCTYLLAHSTQRCEHNVRGSSPPRMQLPFAVAQHRSSHSRSRRRCHEICCSHHSMFSRSMCGKTATHWLMLEKPVYRIFKPQWSTANGKASLRWFA